MQIKGDGYKSGKSKIQDMIGLRVVFYFQDDVDVLAFFYSYGEVVKSSIDELDSSTFRPQRLNLTCNLPVEFVDDFRKSLPEELATYIDSTYEIQIRTIFSEGWHEVEHDLRYKCKEDWEDCESYSRVLNGVIATLETAEWNMKSLFDQMARTNFQNKNYRAMLRNKMHLRIKSEGLSTNIQKYLLRHPHVAESILNADRFVIILTLLNHQKSIDLTYDNLLFLINRIEMNNQELREMEPDNTRKILDDFFCIKYKRL
jgi:ppGpp synthetase/RelA/SpoT-type nucleotidyltranferase